MQSPESTEILNSRFDVSTLSETVDVAIARIEADERGWICTVNVAILMMMRGDAFLQGFVDRSIAVVADGQPLIWVSKLFGPRLPERVTGVDLVHELSASATRAGYGVYLLGATHDIVEQLAQRLRRDVPGIDIRGVADGYFDAAGAPERVDAIRQSGAKILFVGMGVPRQERFIDDHWDDLGVSLAIGVGGSFDVLAGLRARAPEFVQKIGMEWMYRLVQEPRRLAKRYLVTNTLFVYHVVRHIAGRVLARVSPAKKEH